MKMTKKSSAAAIIAGLLTLCFALAMTGCGDSGDTLYFYNWQDYIEPNVLDMFKEETGITVIEDTFDTNETMYVKVMKTGGYDVILPSDYMIERMIKEDLLQKLDYSNIPNAQYIDPAFKNLSCDPNDEFFASYMWGTLGILYDSSKVTETVDSWDILWDEKYKGQIYMYDSVRDTLTAALKKLGYSLNTTNVDELNEAVALLNEQLPLVQTYLGDPVKDKMIAGEGQLALVYSGDALYCQGYNENLMYALPKEGSNIFVDGMCIPKTAKNKEAAEKFINFMLRPDIAALNSEYIGYTTTNKAALEHMEEEFTSNPIFWATDEEIGRCEVFVDLGDFKSEYDRAWNEILIGK